MQESSQPQGPSPNRSIDTTLTGSDNNNQDGHVEVIDRRDMVPVNDVECSHERFVPDPSDETDDFIAMVCANERCPVGYLQTK